MVLQTIQKKILTNLRVAVEIAVDGSKAMAMFTKALEDAGGGASEDHTYEVKFPYDEIFMNC